MLSFVNEHFAPVRAERTAMFSPCGLYRLALGRTWDWDLPQLIVCMVNPSGASAEVDDPTALRVTAFAKRWGYGGWGGVNLFALISSSPKALDDHSDPVGPGNAATLQYALALSKRQGTPILAAWGNNGSRRGADRAFIQRAKEAGVPLICLGLTQHGHPKHPLARGEHRVPDDFEPIPFEPPWLGQVTIGPFTVPLSPAGVPICLRCDGLTRLSGETKPCRRCGGTGEEPNPLGGQP